MRWLHIQSCPVIHRSLWEKSGKRNFLSFLRHLFYIADDFLRNLALMSRADRYLKACRKESVDCTPVWIMRQAGRYLEEYRAVRARHSFIETCKTPELAVEITLQPLRRFELDAAIIFADILLPLEKMGIDFEFTKEDGPQINNTVRTRDDVEKMRAISPWEEMAYLMDAIKMVKREVAGKVPLIGFSGAPFTLAS